MAVAGAVLGMSLLAVFALLPNQHLDQPGMVFIPGGPALLGDGHRHAMRGPSLYEVDAFHIDRFEVTNKDYVRFVAATGRAPAGFADDKAFNQVSQPVTGVTWRDASDYCAWAGKRLPREVEWEKAARGLNAQVYPWGNTLDLTLAHLHGEAPVAVTSYPRDESPYGVRGMAGNVSEWVLNRQSVRAGVCGKGHHHHTTATASTGPTEQENSKSVIAVAVQQTASVPQPNTGGCAFIKGNSWSGRPHMTKLANRMWDYTDAIAEFVGFRCVKRVR